MKKHFISITALLTFFLFSCSSLHKNVEGNFPKKGVVAIYPFENLTQTPFAGIKAAYLTKGVLLSKGIHIIDGFEFDEKDNKLLLKNNIKGDYILKGKVIEWRYKTGIDGEPAVSLYIEVVDKNNNIVWAAAGSKSQWGHKSVSITAQELINELLNKKDKSKVNGKTN